MARAKREEPAQSELKVAIAALYLMREQERYARLLRASSWDSSHATYVYRVVAAATGAQRALRLLRWSGRL